MVKQFWIVAAIVGTLSASSLQEGMSALQKGDKETALKILTPLAEKDNKMEMVHARHILLKNEADAKKVIDAMKGLNGDVLKEKFVQLAKEKSAGPSAPNGGDLGWFSKGQMVKPFEDATWKLQSGEITKTPVQTQFGWHVIYLEDKKQVNEKPIVQRELARIYLTKQKPQASDLEKAEKYLISCANAGDVECKLMLGALYSDALDVLANPMNFINRENPYKNIGKSLKEGGKSAESMYQKAITYLSEVKHPRAYYLLALLYSKGVTMMNIPIVQPDYKEAIKYLKLALKSDEKNIVANAANLYGFLYMNGNGTLQDFNEAEKYFRIAASNGLALAKCNLGQLYLQKGKREMAKKYLKEGYEAGVEYCGQIWNTNGLGQ